MFKKLLKRITFPFRMKLYQHKAAEACLRRARCGETLDERDYWIELDNQMSKRKGQ